jgi:hypothetical protein
VISDSSNLQVFPLSLANFVDSKGLIIIGV